MLSSPSVNDQPAADPVSDRLPAGSGRGGERKIEELFLIAMTGIGFQDAFFAWPKERRDRFDELVRAATREDPEQVAGFLRWLRTETPMRYPALAGVAAFVSERLLRGEHGMSRQLVDAVLRRADDPGHLLAYWTAVYGPALPKPVKRGVADAVTRLYDEHALLAYDTDSHHFALGGFLREELTLRGGIRAARPLRFGEVIELVHPVARDQAQGDLFRYALNRRHGRARTTPESLSLVGRRSELLDTPVAHRRAKAALPGIGAEFAELGISWPKVSAWLGERPGRDVWERLIPAMPVGELLYNLRRFDAAGVGFEPAMAAAARITDAAEVTAAGLGPMRFAAARSGVITRRWTPALEAGAAHSLATIPRLPGRTLIVLNPRDDASVVFGLALAQRCADVDVVALSGKPFEVVPDESPLHGLIRWRSTELGFEWARGLDAVGSTFAGHDRVVLVDDGLDDLGEAGLSADIPLYAWDTAHFRSQVRGHPGMAPDVAPIDPARMVFPGLDDAAFSVIPLIEAVRAGRRPWLSSSTMDF